MKQKPKIYFADFLSSDEIREVRQKKETLEQKQAIISSAFFGRDDRCFGLNLYFDLNGGGIGALYSKMGKIQGIMDGYGAEKTEALVGKPVVVYLDTNKLVGISKPEREAKGWWKS